MAIQESRPNIVVDENFLMLEKRLKKRYAERASVYSSAEAIEQERSGASAFAIAPEAYGDSKFIGGISAFQSGNEGGEKYMTVDDYVAYFGVCHDTFGAMNQKNFVPADEKGEDKPRVLVNRKQIENIRIINERAAAKTSKKRTVRPVAKTEPTKIDSGKLDAFFVKLSQVRGRALASVAAFAVCCTLAVGGIVAQEPDGGRGSAELSRARNPEPVIEEADDEAHTNLLSTLE